MKRSNGTKKGFTIVELLTVMGVIALLIGLLVPALNIVRRIAMETKQKAQFHSIEVAVEIFKNDEGEYPKSDLTLSTTVVTGAQHLAEALVGRDLQGYDPRSQGHPNLDGASPIFAYATTPADEKTASLERRKGPYLKLENVGAFSLNQLYISSIAPIDPCVPVITDVFGEKQVAVGGGKVVKAGTPILYYRANPSIKDLQLKNTGYAAADNITRTYNYEDNIDLVKLGKVTTGEKHKFDAVAPGGGKVGPQLFYEKIWNQQISTNVEGVSYNADSFILMSAGKDGKFGTADDVYNFGE